MDMASFTAAYNGLKTAKEVFSYVANLKIKNEILEKINKAEKSVGEAQDTLSQLREENFKLQEENNNLKQVLREQDEWTNIKGKYELEKTDGGATVYKSMEGLAHFTCPACFVKQGNSNPSR